jgi:hypothetical protein
MQVSKIQMFVLMQNQVLEIRTGMSITRMAKPFRVDFKEAVGLPKRATNLQVLMAVGDVYYQMDSVQEFYDYLNKPHNLVNGQPLVTYDMMKQAYGHKPTIKQVLA